MAAHCGSPERWTTEDDKLLDMMYDLGWSPEAMANKLSRSVDEVNKRLLEPAAAVDTVYE